MTSALKIGTHWERVAESFLHENGLTTLTRNYRCRLGEIDLIMKDGNSLVFVEVRYRRSKAFGSGADTVTLPKQRRIARCANMFLARFGGRTTPVCRFDVASVSESDGRIHINWIRSAFDSAP